MRMFAVVLIVGLVAAPASAQSTYVSAALVADVVRASHSSVDDVEAQSGGEVPGFALRVGTPLGASWGVEAEFARGGEIEEDVAPGLPRLADIGMFFPSATILLPPGTSLPIPVEAHTSSSYTTLAVSLWYQQPITARVSLAYLGGLGFFRGEQEYEFRFGALPGSLIHFGRSSYESESVTYGVRPLAGFESRISLTEHVQLVPGIRLQATDTAWLIRPGVAIGWAF